jgi:hypothetical protein
VIHGDALRPSAVTPHIARAKHAIADLEAPGGGTDTDHDARELPT